MNKQDIIAVNNLINTGNVMVKSLLAEVITTAFMNIKSNPAASITDAINDALYEWDLVG